MNPDVIVVGAGPAGLALSCALADAGLDVTVLEAQPRAALADPAPDGRDIALTHRGVALMRSLGLWAGLQPGEIGRIRQAKVLDGNWNAPLSFAAGDGAEELGHIVPNHAIRRAAWAAAMQRERVTVHAGVRVEALDVDAVRARVQWKSESGGQAQAPLLVAADSRHSGVRRQMGIGAEMRDFARTVIVCRMEHEREHGETAYECFGYERTLAVLPLPGRMSSIVITARADEARRLLELGETDYAGLVQRQFRSRLGAMRVVAPRQAYPLVAVYAHRFVAPRCALIGDAAVGMHPVTAHGYNFGLYGVDALAGVLQAAHRAGRDLGGLQDLRRFEAEHRRRTWAIYQGTNALVGLFTDDRAPARALRKLVLHGSELLPPVKAAVTAQLTGRGLLAQGLALPSPPLWPSLPSVLERTPLPAGVRRVLSPWLPASGAR